MSDLVAKFEEIELVLVSIVALYLIYRFRSRLLAFFTGDDRVHADGFDGIWYTFCRCCGACTGDWSRYVSCCPCFRACDLQHQNLVDAFGRWSGLLQWEIRVASITVGDLPKDSAASYYVSFEVGENMPVNTAVTHLTSPKLIQFHGECVIKVRDASLDNDVRIAVKEMRTLGSHSICEVFIRPDHLIDWASKPGGSTMRFEMKPCTGALNILPAWLLITCEIAKPWEDESIGPWSQAAITVTRPFGQDSTFRSVHDLKNTFPLMNEHGIQVREADEKDAAHFQALVRRHHCGMKFCKWIIILFVIAALLFRTAVTSCYREYKRVLVLHEHGVEFPATERTSTWVLQRCGYGSEVSLADHRGVLLEDFAAWKELLSDNNWHEYTQYLGGGDSLENHPPEPVTPVFKDFGGEKRLDVDPNSTACLPRRADVIQMCYNMPIGARKPTFLRQTFTCRAWTCRYRMLLVPFSLVAVVVLIVVVCATYCVYRRNLRQMREIHKRLVKEAHLRDSRHPLDHNRQPSFNDSWGCCGWGGSGQDATSRQLQPLPSAPSSPYYASSPVSHSGAIPPQE